MADEELDAPDQAQGRGSWRRGWASAGALLATILLVTLVIMVTLSNRARDDALAWERHTYDVMLLTRSLDATTARAEAALGRYVLDEQIETGSLYYSEWRLAGRQIGRLRSLVRSPQQRASVIKVRSLYQQRGRELSPAAAAAFAKRGNEGPSYFYQAGKTPTGPDLRAELDRIASTEREELRVRMAETKTFAAQSDKLTEWLGWLGVLIGIGAISLGIAAYRALTDRLAARQQAESETIRATTLEHAVQERTRELRDANERLRAEAAEREAAEAQLRQVQKMEAIGQLTGGIAHDFNNMLAVVVGGLDLARRKLGISRKEAEDHIENAMEGATRAAALTRRLLAFARSEPLQPEGVAPAALVSGMLDLIDRTIGERIQVNTRFPDENWHVWADPNQLENAVLNLAVNARDAMHGSGELGISIDNVGLAAGETGQLEAGEYVRISVSDTGTGIAPEHLEKVFEPFFTTKPVGKGTGLGLSQLFGFARQSGGDVTLDSRMNAGTTVSLYLPRSGEAAAQAAEKHGRPIHSVEVAPAPAGTFILVVEDDPRVSRSTVSSLEELGYRTIACESGKQALEIMKRSAGIELVITDVMMPEMTGPELVRHLAEDYPNVGILFVTGYVGEAGEATDLAGYAMLRKPFTVAALADAVSGAVAPRASGSRPVSATAAAE
ncbi:MAG: response regulator [Sphingosinicella sp.]|nr:response regulator [Sphingosinicella sp.]